MFARGIGEATDIVRKEMYTFTDKGDRSLTLRPEGTAARRARATRARMHKRRSRCKLCYAGPMFRYERPQAGRYRQFLPDRRRGHRLGDPAADAEVIVLARGHLRRTRRRGRHRCKVNSVGRPACRPAYLREAARATSRPHGDAVRRLPRAHRHQPAARRSTARSTSCRAPSTRRPRIVESCAPECRAHFAAVRALDRRSASSYDVDPRSCAGSTTTRAPPSSSPRPPRRAVASAAAAATTASSSRSAAADAGGGLGQRPRAHRLGDARAAGVPTAPACSWPHSTTTSGLRVRRRAATAPRRRAAELDLAGRSPKGQLKQAGRSGARFAVLLGLEELARGRRPS